MMWKRLGERKALELAPEFTDSGEQTKYSLLVNSKTAYVEGNGRRLEGKTVSREQAGLALSSAFLYFSETWVFPD